MTAVLSPTARARSAETAERSRRLALEAPQVFAPRTMMLLWAASAFTCIACIAVLFIPVESRAGGIGIAIESRLTSASTGAGSSSVETSSLLVLVAPGADERVNVGERVRIGGTTVRSAHIESVGDARESASVIESRYALAPGSVSRVLDATRVIVARIDDANFRDAPLLHGGVFPIEVVLERGSARSVLSFSGARAASTRKAP